MKSPCLYPLWGLVAVLLAALGMSGCATLFNSQPQWVHIAATDQGRVVNVSADIYGRDRYTINLPSNVPLTPLPNMRTQVTVNDRCYETVTASIHETFNPVTLFNIFNYFSGALVDYGSGAMWTFENPVTIPLRRKIGTDCAFESLVAGDSVTTLPMPARRLRHHHLNLGFAGGYGRGGGSGGGTAIAYEYRYSDALSMVARFGSFSTYTDLYGYSGVPSNSGWIDATAVNMSLALHHYLSRMAGAYVGVSMNNRAISSEYRRFNTFAATEAVRINEMRTFAAIDLGWRTQGAAYFGAEVQLMSPSLVMDRQTDVSSDKDWGAITVPQHQERARSIHDKLVQASQINVYVGVAF
ncbi:MAG: hypothetical protein OEW08_07395 [Gammaproteobacteria bacterium]|nr:hypothetical protein [Gammaproteobacteria bacterium]